MHAVRVVLAVGLAGLPPAATAHLVDTGLGPFYDGISHLMLSVDDLLPVLALGLLGGLNGAGAARRVLWTLPMAWFVAGLAGLWAASAASRVAVPDAAGAAVLIALGALVVADRRIALPAMTALAAALGTLNGWFNGAGIASTGRSGLALAGIAATVFVLVALSAALATSARAAWTRIAVRVAGSWIAAAGLLLLGWVLRARGG